MYLLFVCWVFSYILLCCGVIFMQRFKVACVVIDGEDVANFMLVDKITKNLFGSFANNYVYDKQFCDPSIVVPQMVAKLDKNWIFQMRFGAFKVRTNRCDMIATNIFDNNNTNDTNLHSCSSCSLAEQHPIPVTPESIPHIITTFTSS